MRGSHDANDSATAIAARLAVAQSEGKARPMVTRQLGAWLLNISNRRSQEMRADHKE